MTRIKYPSYGAHGMDRVRRISTELLSRFPDKFVQDFEHNKRMVNKLARIRSKVLRNAIAGYLTSYLRKNLSQQGVQAGSSESETMESPGPAIDENRRE